MLAAVNVHVVRKVGHVGVAEWELAGADLVEFDEPRSNRNQSLA